MRWVEELASVFVAHVAPAMSWVEKLASVSPAHVALAILPPHHGPPFVLLLPMGPKSCHSWKRSSPSPPADSPFAMGV